MVGAPLVVVGCPVAVTNSSPDRLKRFGELAEHLCVITPDLEALMSFSTLSRRRTLRAAVPVVGILAAGLLVWQGSNAAFTATTTAGTNSWTAGTLSLQNNSVDGVFRTAGQATFNVSNIKPGDTLTRCVTVQSGGTTAGAGRFFVTGVTGALAPQIQLTVDQGAATVTAGTSNVNPTTCAGFTSAGNVATNVALGTLPGSYAAATNSWAVAGTAGEARAYRITYTFASTGSNAGDNLLQGTSAGAVFNWEVQ
jgi:hypothetical protein